MTTLQALADSELLSKIQSLAADERRITLELLHHLREMEARRLFAKMGYSSLFEYVVHELKYSTGTAHRRVSSMRLLRDLPEIEASIESGKLNLCNLSQAQRFFRQEEKANGEKVSAEKKREVIDQLEGQSARQAQSILASMSPQPLPKEKERFVDGEHVVVSLVLSLELKEKLEQVMAMMPNAQDEGSYAKLIERMADFYISKKDPARKTPKEVKAEKKPEDQNPLPTLETVAESQIPQPEVHNEVPVPAAIRREVFRRDQSQCTFVCRESGRRCDSKYRLQIEHLKPRALGGSNQPENLTVRCFTHNQLSAIQTFGAKKMGEFISF